MRTDRKTVAGESGDYARVEIFNRAWQACETVLAVWREFPCVGHAWRAAFMRLPGIACCSPRSVRYVRFVCYVRSPGFHSGPRFTRQRVMRQSHLQAPFACRVLFKKNAKNFFGGL